MLFSLNLTLKSQNQPNFQKLVKISPSVTLINKEILREIKNLCQNMHQNKILDT